MFLRCRAVHVRCWLSLAVLVTAFQPSVVCAQQGRPFAVGSDVFPGGELERYLRVLQLAGAAPTYPWSLRGFSPAEVARLAPRDTLSPWSARYRFRRVAGEPAWKPVPVRASVYLNTGFPYGRDDGALWQGRGLTTALQAGFSTRYGPVSVVVAPVAFVAQNASFDLTRPPVGPGSTGFSDARHPTQIDRPQRFGDGAYARLDPGQSTLRLDAGLLALGLSTANQVWGPAVEYPLILGTNAAGFPHAFLGTAHPVDLGVGRAHGRFVWGQLAQSAYSPMPADSSLRFMAGVVALFEPRGVPGLEVGASRFFHEPWTGGIRLRQVLKPLETLTKVNLTTRSGDELAESVVANQLASVFFRWALPRSGFEVYGEIASEDHRHNLRDFIAEPDHETAFSLGFQRLWRGRDGHLDVLRAELVNDDASHLQRGRRQDPFYIHASLRQGHTVRGQILGAPTAYGGAGSTVALDRYDASGRWTLSWTRARLPGDEDYLTTGVVTPPDVQQAILLERSRFSGRWGFTGGAGAVHEMNRAGGRNATNLRATLDVTFRP